MRFKLSFTPEAASVLKRLETENNPKLKKVQKALGLLETNPRHPGLSTHEFTSLAGPAGEKVFEAYVESRTPGAWRVFWYYGPTRGMIRVLNIAPHP
ncbi:MAG: hypothetical protein GEU90_19405 [Gemmatimonas sp.]|nr:hypothetical protein [Gemmatimonas sp.]